MVQERQREGRRNVPNVVRIISAEWTAWIVRGVDAEKFAPRILALAIREKWAEQPSRIAAARTR